MSPASRRGRSRIAVDRVRGLWLDLSQGLGFVPGAIVASFGVMGIVLVELDRHLDLAGVRFVFQGDGPAARTVLSVIAGSLITVAGLTFSITMVVLQLAASQFSPRILRTFFGDRVTQVTIGIFVGTFVYSILVLRAVGSFGGVGFVPRLSVTVASLLGIAAGALLIVFLQHVARMVQVSHVTATIARATLARIDDLYPERHGEPVEDEHAGELLGAWRAQPAGRVLPARPGYVRRIDVEAVAASLAPECERVAILVCPGDFVSVETAIVEAWPPACAQRCRSAVLGAVSVASERDLDQDVDFGTRQLTDTALKAISPGINDPMTAVTCIGYLRAILVRLTERAEHPQIRRFPEQEITAIVRRRSYAEHLEPMLQINRYVAGDAWVIGELLKALRACAEAARRCGSPERLRSVHDVAKTIAAQAADEVASAHDRALVARGMAEIDGVVAS